MKTMSNRWDSYMVVGLAVGMTAAYGLLIFAPQQRKMTRLRASITAMEEQLAFRTADVAERSQIEVKLKRADALLGDYADRIPAVAKVGDFVEEVSAVAERLGLRNQSILPTAPRPRGAVTALPIRISFDADFVAAFEFLREIESLPRTTEVTEFAVERIESDEGSADQPRDDLSTRITVQIFHETT